MFDRFVQKHFTKPGAEEYHAENVITTAPVYAARSGEGQSGKDFWRSYSGRKQKSKGHQLAMVFSGATRDGAKRCRITATANGVEVTLPGLAHLNYYKPKPKKYGPHAGEPPLDLRGDINAVSRRELDELGRVHREAMVDVLGQKYMDNHLIFVG